jgi:hypothetical protein
MKLHFRFIWVYLIILVDFLDLDPYPDPHPKNNSGSKRAKSMRDLDSLPFALMNINLDIFSKIYLSNMIVFRFLLSFFQNTKKLKDPQKV